MNKQIYNEILKIEAKGLSNIELLALVTETSYEVIFYAEKDGEVMQSNEMAETGVIDYNFVDKIYAETANIIRSDSKYSAEKLNIVKACEDTITIEYKDKKCQIYKLKKDWKKEIGL